MAELIELDNVEKLLEMAKDYFLGRGRITETIADLSKPILKFKIHSVCEVFGYQMAAAMGIRVSKTRGFWTAESFRTETEDMEPGRIGVLVEYHADWMDVGRGWAAETDRIQVARALALCAFDRYEWGEFGVSEGRLYFYDLERLLPPIEPETTLALSKKDRVDYLHEIEVEYRQGSSAAIKEVLEEAERLDLLPLVREELERLCTNGADFYGPALRITGHPIGSLLSRFAASVFGARLNSVAKLLGHPALKAPRWR